MGLSPEDVEAILHGNKERAERRLNEALGEETQWPAAVKRGVELLAWRVVHGHLEVEVGIRVHGQDGMPQTLAFEGDGYVHEKWVIFEDDENALIASGSLNESRTALVLNAENLEIHVSWQGRGEERLRRKRRNFERMWQGAHAYIRTFALPDAVRRRLPKIAERARDLVEVDGTLAPSERDAGNRLI